MAILLGLCPLKRRRLMGIRIPNINIGRCDDRLWFITGIPIPIRSCLLSEYRPRFASKASASEMILKDMGKTDRHHTTTKHDDVIKWKYFPRHWPFVRGIHRSPVTSPHKGHLRGAFMFYLICAWINGWVNNRETGNLRRHHAHYDVTVMTQGAPLY